MEEIRREADLKIRALEGQLQGLQEAMKLLPRENVNQGKVEHVLRTGSAMAKARELIHSRQEPLHITAILDGIGRTVNHPNRVSVSGSLGNYARKGEIFVRTAPNTFGLIELGHKEGTHLSNESDDLPSNFGTLGTPNIEDDEEVEGEDEDFSEFEE